MWGFSPVSPIPPKSAEHGEYSLGGEIGEIGENSKSSVYASRISQLAQLHGPQRTGLRSDPQRCHFSENVRSRKRIAICAFTHSVTI